MSDHNRGSGSNGAGLPRVDSAPVYEPLTLAVNRTQIVPDSEPLVLGDRAAEALSLLRRRVAEARNVDALAMGRHVPEPLLIDSSAARPTVAESVLAAPSGAPLRPPTAHVPADADPVDPRAVASSAGATLDLASLLDRHQRELADALDRARVEAAEIVSQARNEAVGIVADAIADVRERPFLPATPPVNVALDAESFARCFAAAIAVILEQQRVAAPSATPAPEATAQQVIDLNVQPDGAGFRAFRGDGTDFRVFQQQMPWPVMVAPASKRSFWSNAWHPDVILSVIAMSIVLIILIAFAA